MQLTLFRFVFCLIILGYFLYLYVDKHNQLTQLRLKVPPLTDKVRSLEEEESKLVFLNAELDNPRHLMELLRKPEFSYLKKPNTENVQYIR